MIKLTVTHLTLLEPANRRDDGFIIRPPNPKPAAAAKVAAKMIELGLVREVRAKGDMPIWRTDDQGKAFSLKIMKAGRLAVQSAQPKETEFKTTIEPSAAKRGTIGDARPTHSLIDGAPAKAGSKRTLVLTLMERKQGATIEDLMAATGWLPHTTRAALSGLRKKGLAIVRSRDLDGQASVYRIQAQTMAVAA